MANFRWYTWLSLGWVGLVLLGFLGLIIFGLVFDRDTRVMFSFVAGVLGFAVFLLHLLRLGDAK